MTRRILTVLFTLVLSGCIGTIETTARQQRRIAASARANLEADRRFALSGCVLVAPIDPNAQACAPIPMRCTMGKGTRYEVRNVLVFAAGPKCAAKGEGVCE